MKFHEISKDLTVEDRVNYLAGKLFFTEEAIASILIILSPEQKEKIMTTLQNNIRSLLREDYEKSSNRKTNGHK